jgi:hypothetical protein
MESAAACWITELVGASMFDHFSLAGLTIGNLTAQVTGFLNNAFVVGAILAALALPFAVKIARTIQEIVWVNQPFHGATDDDYEEMYEHLRNGDDHP